MGKMGVIKKVIEGRASEENGNGEDKFTGGYFFT